MTENGKKQKLLKKCCRQDTFDSVLGFPKLKPNSSFGKNNRNSFSTTPKNLAFQLIRAHLVKKHLDVNNRPITNSSNLKTLNQSKLPNEFKENKFIKNHFEKIQQHALKQKYQVNNQLSKSKKLKDNQGIFAFVPPWKEEKNDGKNLSAQNYNMYLHENAKVHSSLSIDDNYESNIMDKIETNTREQLSYNKVDLNKYDSNWSKSLDSFYDMNGKSNENYDRNRYNRNLNSIPSLENINRENLIYQRSNNDLEDIHIHHSKRLILPCITKRYENLDFSMNDASNLNTNYRIRAMNNKTLKESKTKNVNIKDTVSKNFLPDII